MANLVLSQFQSRTPGLLKENLKRLDLTLNGGEITGLNGPSGSGKSLLLRAISDLDPSIGVVALGNVAKGSIAAHEWRQKVAYLATESGWWFDTVAEHFETLDEAMLARLDFEVDVMEWRVSRISSGEKQRLALARCLSRSPQALLLDEPTASLGAGHSQVVEAIISDYMGQNNTPVLWVSHDQEQLRRIAKHYFLIQPDGCLREDEL